MIYIRSSRLNDVNIAETLRYMGVKEPDGALLPLLSECEDLVIKAQNLKACYSLFDVKREDGVLDFGFLKVASKSLGAHLDGCGRVIVFACTAGAGIDRLIQKYSRLSPARATVIQAMGAALVESFCDELCEEFQLSYNAKSSRFSCGYGDLPLTVQRDIFAALNVTKNIGVTLSDNCFMTPTKSVTAFVGIKDNL